MLTNKKSNDINLNQNVVTSSDLLKYKHYED